MSKTIIFVHGWGFDAGVWDPLRAHLPDIPAITIELGFRNAPESLPETPPGEIIAVGHSLGFLWLLKTKPFTWDKLVAINGFSKFLAADDFPSGLDARILQAMMEQCQKDAPAVLADFFKANGHDEKIENLNQDRLVKSLEWSRDWDMRSELKNNQTPLLALAGKTDPISPPSLTEASFTGLKDSRLVWHDDSHLLPLSAPAWCADHIREFIQ
jgi:pimeloyl-[acyl-carrier protein] methyl ester esterase